MPYFGGWPLGSHWSNRRKIGKGQLRGGRKPRLHDDEADDQREEADGCEKGQPRRVAQRDVSECCAVHDRVQRRARTGMKPISFTVSWHSPMT